MMEEVAKAVKCIPLSCAQQALAGGLGVGGTAPPDAADVGNVMIAISQEGAIAAAEQQQEEGEGGVDRKEEEEEDDLPYPQDDDDDDNDSEGEVCAPIGITLKHFDV